MRLFGLCDSIDSQNALSCFEHWGEVGGEGALLGEHSNEERDSSRSEDSDQPL